MRPVPIAISLLPSWVLGIIVVGGFALLSVAGLLAFRRLTNDRLPLSEDMNNDVIFFSSAIGVFYSLVVGLMAVSVWSNYSSVGDVVSGEAAGIAALYRSVGGLPEPSRGRLQADLRDYTSFVIEHTWPAQRRGEILDEATRRMDRFQADLYAFQPTTLGEQAIYAETLRLFGHMVELRRRRVGAIGGNLPGVMWAIVIGGAMLSVGVTYLMKVQTVIQALLTGFFATFIGLVVFVMIGMDGPLTGPLALSADPYRLVLERLMTPR